MSSYPPHYAYPSSPPVIRLLPKPPRLHWAWVLVLTVVTLGLFANFWLLVQANWVRKVRGRSTAFVWAVAYWVFLAVLFAVVVAWTGMAYFRSMTVDDAFEVNRAIGAFGRFGGLVLYLATVSFLRGELQQEPIGIPLHGLASYFFGPVYFQACLANFSFGEAGGQGGSTPVAGVVVEQDKSI